MEIYNLRFGQATTPRQRQIYRDLFAQIDAVRNQVVRGVAATDDSSASWPILIRSSSFSAISFGKAG